MYKILKETEPLYYFKKDRNIVKNVKYERGFISMGNGEVLQSSSYPNAYSSEFIPVNNSYYITNLNKSKNRIRLYGKDKKYIRNCDEFSNIKYSKYDFGNNVYYIRILCLYGVQNHITLIEIPIYKYLIFETGSINFSTGQNQNLSSTLRTDFIEVQENEKYKIRYYNENIIYGLRCYDKDKNYINGEAINSNIITIPTGTNFIRLIRKDLSEPYEYLERI